MRDIKKILCAVDILEPDLQVAEYASALAKKFDASVTVLYVAPHLAQYSRYAEIEAIKDIHKVLAQKVEDGMKSFTEAAFTDDSVKVESIVVEGESNAANEIIAFTEENNMDVIVMGTRSKTGLERLLLGSVASKVIKTAPVPVFTINPA